MVNFVSCNFPLGFLPATSVGLFRDFPAAPQICKFFFWAALVSPLAEVEFRYLTGFQALFFANAKLLHRGFRYSPTILLIAGGEGFGGVAEAVGEGLWPDHGGVRAPAQDPAFRFGDAV